MNKSPVLSQLLNPSLLRAELARRNLMDFITFTKSDYQVNHHHRVLAEHLDKFVAGEIRRLMVFMPPRMGKSEQVSRRLPAYILGRNPDAQIIACSYSADLASRMNRDVQRIIETPEYQMVFPATKLSGANVRTVAQGSYLRNSDIFEVVGRRGTYRSAGVGGGITGMGFHYGIIDDPIKNQDEADSEVYRNGLWEWYTSTFYTRQEKDASILITLTRWHEDDLAGRLLDLAGQGGDKFTVVHFPALDEQGRSLWPDKYPVETLQQIKETVGPRVWQALYQGNPQPPTGSIFQRDWFTRPAVTQVPDRPNIQVCVQAWDTALKEGQENDYSACVTIGQRGNNFYVLDVYRAKLEYPALVKQIKEQAATWRPNAIVIEDRASGTSALQTLRQETTLPIVAIPPVTDKVARANLVTGTCEAKRVQIPLAPPGDMLLDELLRFPTGKHDDMVDAFVYALNRITQTGWRARVREY